MPPQQRKTSLIFTLATGLFALLFTVAACDRDRGEEDADQRDSSHLEAALLAEWSLLVDDIAMESASGKQPSSLPTYHLDENCPLVYDFSLRWPINPQLMNETLGRFELRTSSPDTSQVEVLNRATGSYPVYDGRHHPGPEWWEDEIEPTMAVLNAEGLRFAQAWPGPWRLGTSALGVPAFFPALPKGDEFSTSWTPDTAGDKNLIYFSRKADRIVIDGHPALILEARPARPKSEIDFFGRFVISEAGRLLAAIWATEAPNGRAALATARLTGVCDGPMLPPLPGARHAGEQAGR